MNESERRRQIEEVRKWWNIKRNDLKWNRAYDDNNAHALNYLRERQAAVLNFVDDLNLPQGSKVLELGYGAGQTALELGKRGFEVYGLDISEKFSQSATKRCRNHCPGGKFNLGVGNIEGTFAFEDGAFDLVIVIGALQYLHSPERCLAEVFRTLKKGGLFIVAQRNAYSLSNLTSFRDLLRSSAHFFLREEFELFPSIRSVLLDSKLKRVVSRYEHSRFMNSNFVMKGHAEWKFKIKKRLYSYFTLRSYLKNAGFSVLKTEGAYFAFSELQRFADANIHFNRNIKKIAAKWKIPFLFTLGRSVVALSVKRER